MCGTEVTAYQEWNISLTLRVNYFGVRELTFMVRAEVHEHKLFGIAPYVLVLEKLHHMTKESTRRLERVTISQWRYDTTRLLVS